VHTTKLVVEGQMRSAQFSLASSLHLSFVFEVSGKAVAMATSSSEVLPISTAFVDTATVMHRAAVEKYQRRFPEHKVTNR